MVIDRMEAQHESVRSYDTRLPRPIIALHTSTANRLHFVFLEKLRIDNSGSVSLFTPTLSGFKQVSLNSGPVYFTLFIPSAESTDVGTAIWATPNEHMALRKAPPVEMHDGAYTNAMLVVPTVVVDTLATVIEASCTTTLSDAEIITKFLPAAADVQSGEEARSSIPDKPKDVQDETLKPPAARAADVMVSASPANSGKTTVETAADGYAV
jgi:hypothetical protein